MVMMLRMVMVILTRLWVHGKEVILRLSPGPKPIGPRPARPRCLGPQSQAHSNSGFPSGSCELDCQGDE
eukprot:25596-Karenia_brevis.AAC.1